MSAFSMLQSRMGAIIQCYTNPTSSIFQSIITQKNNHPNVPIAVVLNVNEGPGTSANTDYANTMQNLVNAGIITLGYVYTNFGEVAEATVKQDIDRWKSFYGTGSPTAAKCKGIFFAAMSNQAAKETYYHNLHDYARVNQGFLTTVGNAANHVPTSFMGSNCSDTIITYEGGGLPPKPGDWSRYQSVARNNVALTPYAVSSVNTEWTNQISAYASWIYYTSDSQPNPWDQLPSYFADLITLLDNMGEGSSTGSSFDSFGIRKIYHTKQGGEEWYVNMQDPTSDERFQNEPALTKNNDGSYSCEGDDADHQVRLEAWSPAYSDQTQRQNARWLNVEISGYAKAETEYTQGGPYLFQWYGRGGHHSTTRHCEGSTLKAALWRRKIAGNDPGIAAGARKEVCHSAYCDNRAVMNNAAPWDSTDFFNKWIGFKLIIMNYTSGSSTFTRQELYSDPDVQDSNGNLDATNQWKFLTRNEDTGGWQANSSSFNTDCDSEGNCGYPRDRIITMPGGDTRSSSANFNRNLVAWRTDNFRWRWKFLTAREIDPSKPASGDPAPPPINDPPSAFDTFGVRKIYQTKSGGNEWFQAANPANDARFKSDSSGAVTITNFTDGSFSVKDVQQIVFNVEQPNLYDGSKTAAQAENHLNCANNGYMQDSQDWRNVEATWYVRVNATMGSGGDCELALYCRGGRHINPTPNCQGSSMKVFLNMPTGGTRFTKEQYHLSYHNTSVTNQTNTSLIGRWIGMKFVVYNRLVSGTSTIRLECYLDTNESNTWIKVDERNDTTGWGTDGLQCRGSTSDFRISWGGPIFGFRVDNASNVDFKKMSVRELSADTIAIQPPPDQNPSSCGS